MDAGGGWALANSWWPLRACRSSSGAADAFSRAAGKFNSLLDSTSCPRPRRRGRSSPPATRRSASRAGRPTGRPARRFPTRSTTPTASPRRSRFPHRAHPSTRRAARPRPGGGAAAPGRRGQLLQGRRAAADRDRGEPPSPATAAFLGRLYTQGLGEFAWRTGCRAWRGALRRRVSASGRGPTPPAAPAWARGRWCRSAAARTRSSRWPP